MKLNGKIKGFMVMLLLCNVGFMPVSLPAQQSGRSSEVIVPKTTSVNNVIDVKTVENRIIVSNAPVNTVMKIYNIIGVKVKEITMKHSSGEYTVSLPQGYYIVRIAGTVRKIVIR